MKLSQHQVLENNKHKENLARVYEMMDEAKVKQYLLENPNFLIKNPELLSHIELQYGEQETFSLVERQVKTLRDKNSELQGQQINMLQTAHANEELLILCNEFMLDLVGCESLAVLTSKIITQLRQSFELDGAALVLVGDYEHCAPAQVFESADKIKELLNCQFPDNQPLCGRLGQSPKEVLFGELSYNYQSCALIPLGRECEHGLIALASKDVLRFDPEMGTLFVELIAKYITALVTPYERA
ncbi:MAG: DUF484 family protein [Kangiellaceae bacterium]|nr:DUF484 family protein [Kangiellaceae bacterium]